MVKNSSIYKANRHDISGNMVSSILVEVLSSPEKIGGGYYGSIDKIKVRLGNKKLPFALKSFKTQEETEYAIQMYQKVKNAKLSTWNTYRHLEGTNDVLMTLGNADGSLVFSPHNASEDREKAKSEHILEAINNKEALFEQAWEEMKKSAEKNLILAWDSYFLKWKDEKLSLIIGDLDQVCVWKRPPALSQKVEENIKEFFGFLSCVLEHFEVDYRNEFFVFLEEKQKSGDAFLSAIDIKSLYQWCSFVW